jgi:hypothetical protein
VAEALQTKWGRLFASYGDGQVVMPGVEPKTVMQAAFGLAAIASLVAGLALIGGKKKKKAA